MVIMCYDVTICNCAADHLTLAGFVTYGKKDDVLINMILALGKF